MDCHVGHSPQQGQPINEHKHILLTTLENSIVSQFLNLTLNYKIYYRRAYFYLLALMVISVTLTTYKFCTYSDNQQIYRILQSCQHTKYFDAFWELGYRTYQDIAQASDTELLHEVNITSSLHRRQILQTAQRHNTHHPYIAALWFIFTATVYAISLFTTATCFLLAAAALAYNRLPRKVRAMITAGGITVGHRCLCYYRVFKALQAEYQAQSTEGGSAAQQLTQQPFIVTSANAQTEIQEVSQISSYAAVGTMKNQTKTPTQDGRAAQGSDSTSKRRTYASSSEQQQQQSREFNRALSKSTTSTHSSNPAKLISRLALKLPSRRPSRKASSAKPKDELSREQHAVHQPPTPPRWQAPGYTLTTQGSSSQQAASLAGSMTDSPRQLRTSLNSGEGSSVVEQSHSAGSDRASPPAGDFNGSQQHQPQSNLSSKNLESVAWRRHSEKQNDLSGQIGGAGKPEESKGGVRAIFRITKERAPSSNSERIPAGVTVMGS